MLMERLRTPTLLIATGLAGLIAGACVTESNFAQRFAEAACDRAERCEDKLGIKSPYNKCVKELEKIGEDLLDECKDYNGSLAYKCLQDSEELGCLSEKQPKSCKDFNKECGFNDSQQGTGLVFDDGEPVTGLGDWAPHAPTE